MYFHSIHVQSKAKWKKQRETEEQEERMEPSDDDDVLDAFSNRTDRLSTMLEMKVSGLLLELLAAVAAWVRGSEYFILYVKIKTTLVPQENVFPAFSCHGTRITLPTNVIPNLS